VKLSGTSPAGNRTPLAPPLSSFAGCLTLCWSCGVCVALRLARSEIVELTHPLIQTMDSRILTPTDFSPLQ
jgi:hypothetical protein